MQPLQLSATDWSKFPVEGYKEGGGGRGAEGGGPISGCPSEVTPEGKK